MSKSTDAAEQLKQQIEEDLRDLPDDEYLEALEDIVSFCDSCIEAKNEERGGRRKRK